MTKAILFFGVLSASVALFGCASDDEVPTNPIQGELEIKGIWASNFGTIETIDDDNWTIVSKPTEDGGGGAGGADGAGGESAAAFPPTISRIEDFSNQSNEMVTQNAEDAEYSPGLYNRIVWTELEGRSFYYCTTDFGVPTAAAAEALNTAADTSDPENSGCGDFSWTKLTRE